MSPEGEERKEMKYALAFHADGKKEEEGFICIDTILVLLSEKLRTKILSICKKAHWLRNSSKRPLKILSPLELSSKR